MSRNRPACPIVAVNSQRFRHVRFGRVETYPYVVYTDMLPISVGRLKTLPTKPKVTLSRADIQLSEMQAVQYAAALAIEVGIWDVHPLMSTVQSCASKCRPDCWLMDTGSGNDLVCYDLVSEETDRITPDRQTIRFDTAGGPTQSRGQIFVAVEELGEHALAIVLDSTPNVLSVGLRVMEYGYSFSWPAFSVPTITTPQGRVIELGVHDYIPYLRTGGSSGGALAPAMPPTSESSVFPNAPRPAVPRLHADGRVGPLRGGGPIQLQTCQMILSMAIS